MKRKLMMCVWAALMCACQMHNNKQKDIVLRVEVQQKPEMGFVISYLRENMQTIELDERGHGECIISGLEEVYLTLHNGFTEQKVIYAEAGDQITIAFDGKSMEKTLVMKGDRKPITDYLSHLQLKWPDDNLYRLEVAEYVDSLKAATAFNMKLLNSRKTELEAASEKFTKLEEGRIHAAMSFALLQYPQGHGWKTGNKSDRPGEDYFQALRLWMTEDPLLVDLYEYRILMTEGAAILGSQAGRFWNAYDKLLIQIRYMGKNFRDEYVKQSMIHLLACQYIRLNGVLNTDDLGNLYRQYVKDENKIKQYTAIYEDWARLLPGKPLPDFEAVDSTGKTYTLQDFQGKKVCLYLWQSFYPCIKEFSYLDSLRNTLDEKQIQLVCLSMDQEKEKWQNSIRQPLITSATHLYLGANMDYLNSIHYISTDMFQFILLDEQGNIIQLKLPVPSSGKLGQWLEKKIK